MLILPDSHLPWQNRMDSGTAKIKVNQTKVRDQMPRPVHGMSCVKSIIDLAKRLATFCVREGQQMTHTPLRLHRLVEAATIVSEIYKLRCEP